MKHAFGLLVLPGFHGQVSQKLRPLLLPFELSTRTSDNANDQQTTYAADTLT
ncbi:MAG: hypothetical protein KF693_03295 [Nitrospira sp.]|nr:hypothetical protein [Nitrospira sp.]